jgi:hypothetical protein
MEESGGHASERPFRSESDVAKPISTKDAREIHAIIENSAVRNFFHRDNSLSKELLTNPDFRPTRAVEIDGKDFLVGPIIRGGDRDEALMFVRQNGKLLPRALYKSNSDGGWRSCPGFEMGRFSKGNGIHYTQETKPHEKLIRYLEDAEKNAQFVTYDGDVVQKYFNRYKNISKDSWPPDWDTYKSETDKYDDKGILSEFQKFPPGYMLQKGLRLDKDLSELFSNFDFSSPQLREFKPDFTKDPVRKFIFTHTMLGEVNAEVFSARLNGRPVEWVIAYDASGRTWIERITFSDIKVNSYGVSPEVIDSGALTNKPIEYISQLAGLVPDKEFIGIDHTYADITPLLHNLPPIKEFRDLKGLSAPKRPAMKEAINTSHFASRLADAKDVSTVLSVLDQVEGLQGSNKWFSSVELKEIVQSVINGDIGLDSVTRAGGLRDAVSRIINSPRNGAKDTKVELPDRRDFPARLLNAASPSDIFEALETVEGLQGSNQFYSKQELERMIRAVFQGEARIDSVTRTAGLRDAVSRILGSK